MNGRKQYAGHPTKWQYLSRFMKIRREEWPAVRTQAFSLVQQGRISVAAYEYNYNVEVLKSWKSVVALLEKVNSKPDPTLTFNQINIQNFGSWVVEIENEIQRIKAFLEKQRTLPFSETEGAKFNTQYNLNLVDIHDEIKELDP